MLRLTLLTGCFTSVALALSGTGWIPSSALTIVTISLLVAILLQYATFQCHAFAILARIAWEAREEMRYETTDRHAAAKATRALATVALLAGSAGTTVLYIISYLAWVLSSSTTTRWIYEVAVILDIPFDVTLALLCAGLVGPGYNRETE